MSANAAHTDNENQVFSIIGVQGTQGTSDIRGTAPTLPIGVDSDNGAMYVHNLGITLDSLSPYRYDSITASYPNGTTEMYAYAMGTLALGTLTVTYTDMTKGSISTVVKT
jgi:hypothetical protein